MAKDKKNETNEEIVEEVVENAEPTVEEKLTAELNETKDKLLRVMAEYDNFRKRSQKEKEMAYGDTKASTIAEFLPVYDNFIRAMSAEAADLDSFKKGIEMIFNQYGETFKKLGVESFGEKGETFDPNIHNAVMHVDDETVGDNIIVEELMPGYKYKEKIIRHSMVKVAN